MDMGSPRSYKSVRYFRERRLPRKGWRYLFQPGTAYCYVVLHDDGTQEVVDSNGLSNFLGLDASGSRVDLFFCRDRARAVLESGDTESWIEFPTGRTVKNPHNTLSVLRGPLSVVQEHFVPYQFTHTVSQLQELLGDLTRSGWAVRTVRGRKMRHKLALFDEFSAAFQFPLHFGETWDAFYDCISDLQWLAPQTGYLLVITEPEELLVDASADELTVFLEILKDTHARFTAPLAHDGTGSEPVGFHVVVISEDTGNPRLHQWEEILKCALQQLP